MKKKNISIKTRISRSTFLLILSIFGVIILVFNLCMHVYIEQTGEGHLKYIDKVRNELVLNYNTGNVLQDIQTSITKLKPKINNIKTETKSFVITNNYIIVDYIEEDEVNLIVTKIKDQKLDLNELKATAIQTTTGSYYISATPIEEYQGEMSKQYYLCFYVDVSNISNFAMIINSLLIIIIAIALIFTFLITRLLSKRITKPIKELSELATKMGKGNFKEAQKELHLDQTELKELADTMNKAAKQLEIYDKDQKVFFQNASHELRTPLMSIKCYAEGIEYGIMDKDEAVQTIISEVNKMTEMIEDLLYVSKIDNITNPYEVSTYDLREIISTSAGRQKPIAEKEGIKFVFDFDKQEVNLTCNEKLMARAFSNLISNAIRHAKESITLICKEDKNNIKISVMDDGEGVSKEDSKHIFERFYKGKNGNHGIGLSIVKSIVEQHGGKVYLEETKVGAKFTIEFKK